MIPAKEVVRVLERAYRCPGFDGPCEELIWDPDGGFFPRGFGGATGEPGDVELLLVLDHPPRTTASTHPDRDAPASAFIEWVCRQTFLELSRAGDLYHRNLRYILERCFPGSGLGEQLRRSWITQSVLCPEPVDGATIPGSAALECRSKFLAPQLELFPGAKVVALGRTTSRRLRGRPGVLEGGYPGPPECNRPGVREGWDRIGQRFTTGSEGN